MARTRLTAVAVAGVSATAVGASIASNFATAPTPVQVMFGAIAVATTLAVALRAEAASGLVTADPKKKITPVYRKQLYTFA